MAHKSNVIKIVGGLFTSRKRAEVLVARGKAVWVTSRAIRFYTSNIPARISSVPVITHNDSQVQGFFRWRPKLSGGYNVMQAKREDKQ